MVMLKENGTLPEGEEMLKHSDVPPEAKLRDNYEAEFRVPSYGRVQIPLTNKWDLKKAAQALEKLGSAAEPALRKAMKDQVSAEVRRQVDGLLEKLRSLPPERLQTLRALEVLEGLDTPESRQLLEKLAAGPADAWPTKEAKAITKRLASKGRSDW